VRWTATIPATASIAFAAQTGADNSSLLPATTPLAVATATESTSTSSLDVAYLDTGTTGTGAFSTASPIVISGNLLHLTITLNPTTDQLSAPTLLNWSVVYECAPGL
jgi:hypothetical protein